MIGRRRRVEATLPRVTSAMIADDLAAGRLSRSWTLPSGIRTGSAAAPGSVPSISSVRTPSSPADLAGPAPRAGLIPGVAWPTLDLGDGTPIRIEDAVVIGRRSATPPLRRSILLDDPGKSVSREHAAVRPTPDGGLLVEDLGSANGTAVVRASGAREDSAPGRPVIAYPGDVVMVGDYAARVGLA